MVKSPKRALECNSLGKRTLVFSRLPFCREVYPTAEQSSSDKVSIESNLGTKRKGRSVIIEEESLEGLEIIR